MARYHRVLLALALLVAGTTSTVSSAASQICPRGLDTTIYSNACSADRPHMFTRPARVTIDAGDSCGVSLRVLLQAVAASMPCTVDLGSPTLLLHPGNAIRSRQLESSSYVKGKFKCKFDTAAPLNVSDLSHDFLVDCEEILERGSYVWLWIMLVCFGGIFMLGCLAVCAPCSINKIKPCLARCRESRRQQAIARAKAEALYTKA